MLKIVGLTKSFDGHKLFEKVSFSCEAGLVLSAPSGWGKTTLLRILMGLETADEGKILELGRVGAVFQEDRLIPHLNAVENVALVCGREADRMKICRLLSRLGLENDALRLPAARLSGGQKRRTALARALLYPCDTLLLDEPFTGMDEEIMAMAAQLILEMQQERAVLLATHDQTAIRLLGWPVLELNKA